MRRAGGERYRAGGERYRADRERLPIFDNAIAIDDYADFV